MKFVNAARVAVLSLAGAALSVTIAGCGQGQQQGGGPPLPTVTVAKPTQRTVVDQDEYVGRFAAVNSVEIRSRLSGYLADIHFKDGQMVKKGDPLFTIDRRPFEIALEQMRANLAQARANLAFTEADLERGLAAKQEHHRAGLWPAHAGQGRRRSRRRRAGCDGAFGRARPRAI